MVSPEEKLNSQRKRKDNWIGNFTLIQIVYNSEIKIKMNQFYSPTVSSDAAVKARNFFVFSISSLLCKTSPFFAD